MNSKTAPLSAKARVYARVTDHIAGVGRGFSVLCADLGITPEVQPDHTTYLAH